tara:strand:- start:335 stop:739 length:405 start_codon:yes stop_codon:yes gene_type:complete
MQIIGFNLTKISIDRKEKVEGKLEIKQNINIDDITKDKINISENEILKLNFTFNVDYNPDFAKVELKGQVVLIPEKEELKEIIKSWKKKEVPEKFRVPLFNFIMSKCNIKALALEDEMALPLHVPMPKLNPKKE